jgi:hypothetical protein
MGQDLRGMGQEAPRTGQLSGRTVNILVPAGALGSGVSASDVERGIALGAHAIACDAGSTDSGPSYLARGVSKVSREAVKRDLAILVPAALGAAIPLVIGSCATAGTDAGVEWTRDIVLDILREQSLSGKIALLYSEQSADIIKRKITQHEVFPLPPAGELSTEDVDRCDHIVALMGVEPYIAALSQGADIILGGRTTDTAVLGCVAIMRGAGAGPTWHAAKVAECGSLCTVNPREGGVMVKIGETGFEIEPLRLDNRCTPYTVSAHMLYENGDPFRLTEPGGVLDVTNAAYEPIDDRCVAVTGSRWEARPYSMKLEGASSGPFQTIMMIGIRDPKVLGSLELFQERLEAHLRHRVETTLDDAGDYSISLRIYGWNAVRGAPPPEGTPAPPEVGVLFIATAATQELATRIAKTCNPHFFHFALERGTELPSYAYPFSPAEIERGQVFEFRLNHVVAVDDPMELVRLAWTDHSDTRSNS